MIATEHPNVVLNVVTAIFISPTYRFYGLNGKINSVAESSIDRHLKIVEVIKLLISVFKNWGGSTEPLKA